MSQLVVERLDSQTRREWQMKQADEEFPSLKELITQIEQKFQVLETLKPSINAASVKETQGGNKQRRSLRGSKTFVAMTENKCVLCSKSHNLFECTVFFKCRYSPKEILGSET